MGAAIFTDIGYGDTVTDAFRNARSAAFMEYGRGGYTGTIAEKNGVVEYEVPDGTTVNALIDALTETDGDDEAFARLVDAYGPGRAKTLFDTFDDKWGDAVAFRLPDRTASDGGPTVRWAFCGWASC
jgi:hypothetical protein